jgi:hypothetical protein
MKNFACQRLALKPCVDRTDAIASKPAPTNGVSSRDRMIGLIKVIHHVF